MLLSALSPFSIGDQPLTLLHSESSKMYTILTFLSAVGLKERICSSGRKFSPVQVDPF